jgi:hypothetical protein
MLYSLSHRQMNQQYYSFETKNPDHHMKERLSIEMISLLSVGDGIGVSLIGRNLQKRQRIVFWS